MKAFIALVMVLLPVLGMADVVVPAERVQNSVNIRLEPDATTDVVGKLNKGDSLPLVSSQPGWHEVALEGGATGFISADWSDVRADEEPEEAVEVAAATDGGQDTETAVDADVEQETEVEQEIEEAVESEVAEAVETTEVDDVALGAASVEEEPKPDVEVEAAPSADAASVVVSGPPGPQGPPGEANIKGSENFLVRFRKETEGGNSQIYDNGNQVGIGTTDPKQRLEVNGSIQIHEQNSSVAGLMITQSSGDTGYIMHNLASTLTIGAGSQDRITIDREGNVGIGVAKPVHPLELVSGAHVSTGGVWTNASSRDLKENIAGLSAEEAESVLAKLEPVTFNYRSEQGEGYVGFIAEDVPDLVASNNRQSLSAMDIVAVLTKVVQQQQQRIDELEARLDAE